MLLDLREKVRSSKPIKYTLITVISIPFALVGVGSYFSGRQAAGVAEVNGVEISPAQLDSAYSQQRQRLAQMFGGEIPEGFANENLLRQQALEQLITQQVLRSEVEEQRFAVGDETLGRAIRNMPAFQVEGKFDNETYQNQLGAVGMSVPAFEQQFRDDTAMTQFRAGVTDTSFQLPQEKARLDELSRQTRTIDFVQFDMAAAKEKIDVSDEDVSAWFDENADSYQFPQRAKVQYIELDSAAIAEGFDITDEDASAEYEANRRSYMVPESRSASHILLSLDDAGDADEVAEKTTTLADIKKRIEDGESFDELANEFSDDVGSAESGGSLGSLPQGTMAPEFDQALYALADVDAVSEPVVSGNGIHLIKLDGITPESGKPFEEVKQEVIDKLRREQADREFFDLREQLSEVAFDSPESLEPAADATGLEVQTSDWIDSETDSGPVLSSPQVQSAAFSVEVLDEGNNSDLIELSDRQVVVVRVLEHEEPRPKTLEDVKEQIADTLRDQRAAEQLDADSAEMVEKLQAGDAIGSLADANELATATSDEELDRQSTTLDREVVNDIYALAKPAEDKPVVGSGVLASGDRVVYALKSVGTSEPDAAAEEEPQQVADQQLGGSEFNALLESLRSRAEIDIAQ